MATLSTKLEAVNTMLSYIGEAPVNSIADTSALPISASTAIVVLDEASREVQSDPWHFNTETEYTLTPVDSVITLPNNTLHVDVIDATQDVIQRGLRLYNRKDRTYTFTKDVKVHIQFLLDWDDLHEPARRYIMLRAARLLQARIVGSKELEAVIIRDEAHAKARLEENDYQASDRTIFDNIDTAARVGINRNYRIT